MSKLEVLYYPDSRLREVAKKVDNPSELNSLAKDMLETMYDLHGIGLAATQVNINKRIMVIDLQQDNKKSPLILINPSFDVIDEQLYEYNEGCLSVPEEYANIKRPQKIQLHYQDLKAIKHSNVCEGLLAVCIQHEIDHLDGKLFVDYLSPLKQTRIANRIKKKLLQGEPFAIREKSPYL